MKRGLVLLANGFEDSEAIVTIDILNRAKVELDIVSMSDSLEVVTQYKNHLVLNKKVTDVFLDDYDFLFIPGGGAVFSVLTKMEIVETIILDFYNKNKPIATICAAPSLVGKLGLFKDKKFTCYPGCEKGIAGHYTGSGVEVDSNFITGKSMAYTVDFALQIVNYLNGYEEMKKVEDAIYGK